MPLKAFSFPVPETRLFKVNDLIYKFRIRGGTSGKGVRKDDSFNQEMEEIIRTVFGNLDRLQPFSTNHFIVLPCKKRREKTHEHSETRLYPFTLVLYLEKNMQSVKNAATEEEEVMQPPSKRCRRDSPLEEAILKDLLKDMEAEGKITVTGTLGLSHHAEGQVNEDPALVDKPEILTDTEEEEGTPVRPGILKRLASHIFPFFFRSTAN